MNVMSALSDWRQELVRLHNATGCITFLQPQFGLIHCLTNMTQLKNFFNGVVTTKPMQTQLFLTSQTTQIQVLILTEAMVLKLVT